MHPDDICARLLSGDMTKRCIGLDIDGTITAAPTRFAQLATAVFDRGGRVVVITSRSVQGHAETVLELAGYGLRYSELHFLPSLDDGANNCPHKELDWFSRYLWCKVAIAGAAGVTEFVDDDPRVISLFRRFAPQIGTWVVG